eukprot:jgi/Mesvir1/17471/Mv26486-RA.1
MVRENLLCTDYEAISPQISLVRSALT